MLQISAILLSNFRVHLIKKGIHSDRFQEYRKWLHFFLDFCEKYQIEGDTPEKLRKFINKLKEKNQSENQRRFAYHAVSLYFDMLKSEREKLPDPISVPEPVPRYQTEREELKTELNLSRKSQYSEAGYHEKSDSPEWDKVLETMATEIKVRHYSRKTLQTYAKWSRSFQRFLKD
ncbi:MAG: integron integrase, partial [Desulfuromonadaceae bacterium]|nr:integron integrase [Desulfuromonadaceae bacterium]